MISRKFVQRTNFLTGFLLLLLLVVVWRLVSIQIFQAKRYQELLVPRFALNEVPPPRGSILDRNGEVLAKDVEAISIFACPVRVKNPQEIAQEFSQMLSLNEEELRKALSSNMTWFEIKRKVPLYLGEFLFRQKWEGIYWENDTMRFYPKAPLLSNLLGFVGSEGRGLEGIEFVFDSYLRGDKGYSAFEKDALGGEIPLSVKYSPPRPGYDLVLTIDANIQFFVEKALDGVMERTKAQRGVIIVNDPRSGDILAMASRPSYDNRYFWQHESSCFRNLAFQMVFEPGSTIKPLVMAGALEEKVVSLRDRFFCPGWIQVHTHRVRDIKAHGEESLEDVIINSCNVGIIEVARKLTAEKLYVYLRNFGLGGESGIEMPGEEMGLLRSPKEWSLLSIGAIPIGQEMMITPLQLLKALSALANKGVVMKPRLVSKIVGAGDKVVKEFPVASLKRVVSEKTASVVLEMMEKTVERGTGKKAFIEGYRIAGKTGTGQKVDASGRYALGKFYSSFVGFLPLPEPRFGILIMLDEPQGEYYGGDIAAPVFREIALNIIDYAGIISKNAEVKVF
ncbi:MAG: penicillin-binding protein 2 [Atribacterota bacterium]